MANGRWQMIFCSSSRSSRKLSPLERYNMKTISQDHSASVSLVAKEIGPDASIRCSVSVVSYGFKGGNRAISFSRAAVEAFALRLQALGTMRSGDASLRTADPDEFSLSFVAMDEGRHIQCRISVSRSVPEFGHALSQQLSAEFMIDPNTLPQLCQSVQSDLLNCQIHEAAAEFVDEIPCPSLVERMSALNG